MRAHDDHNRLRVVGRFDEAATRVSHEIQRLEELVNDIHRHVRDMRWAGQSADYFRRHAAYQAVRVRHNQDLLKSLRVLLLRAADHARHARPGVLT